MTVRAKFLVESKTETSFGKDETGFVVNMRAVCEGSAENEQFFKWTPAGTIQLGTINKQAAEALEVGVAYYVDFIRAE